MLHTSEAYMCGSFEGPYQYCKLFKSHKILNGIRSIYIHHTQLKYYTHQ